MQSNSSFAKSFPYERELIDAQPTCFTLLLTFVSVAFLVAESHLKFLSWLPIEHGMKDK